MTRWMPLAALLLAASAPAMAHQLWLERDGQTARAYFGEPVENQREKTGGLLDRIPGPRLFAADLAATLPLTRAADHFSAALPAGTGDVRLVEDGLPPFGREEKTRTVMLAREGRSETRHALDLELVPVAAGGNEFTLLLRGQPLPRAEVTLVAPPRWERKLRTDAQGRVRFETPWAGRYVAEAIHTEATPGGSGEGAYARLRYVSTLSFIAEGGIPWTER
ncbi:DUF4198 domain-containing protein [Siccirubricoccus sp. KC 17139]|uniref:DUF4198 domain-containing protein n=1 Tax=Siccirubricoccus soli TaxID=2899147 RepID=A0ABT1D798_9PROT|nr:DUF4198 domain-containing protein [Siccirubricoccus soli]MCO6417754.1 DUF4198 domain-containing protein [Siccirubricoccus soli]MCP2683889.1 DUF4198 domain-containing protein [Siccirubricoccus soli]